MKVDTVVNVFSINGFFFIFVCAFNWNFTRADAVNGTCTYFDDQRIVVK